MILLQTIHITKSFGIDTILSDINIQIQSNDRVGLVGVNGAGKSTLLKIIVSKILQDSGDVLIAKGAKVGYLAQDSGLESNHTIWDELLTVFSHLIEQEKYIRNLENKMATPSVIDNEEEYERIMNEYSYVIEDFKNNNGYSYEAKIRSILHGLGFQQLNYQTQPIRTLSGGQKTRLALAKLLLEEPEILILDEPTNYLDVETLTWLENYLKSYSGAILLVSHDRYFLDSLVTTIYEIERNRATKYSGNYSYYIVEKANQIELQMKKYEKQQAEISKLEEFIQKNITRASTTRRAQSRRKVLEKMDVLDRPSLGLKTTSFSFETEKESGKNVLMVNDLTMGFHDKILFKNVTFHVNKQERIALIGPNGIGKSTLFKLITEQIQPLSGNLVYGSNVTVGYYKQEQEDLDINKTVIDEIWDEYPDLKETEIRTILGTFLFIGDDVFKKVNALSGGEKARISLAKLILKKANFLLLDEPTNHLDIFSREALENALIDYPGTIFFISHDRYFLNRISTRTLELTTDGMKTYLGNYDYFLEKKSEIAELLNSTVQDPINNKGRYEENRQQQRAERQIRRRISTLEEEIEKLESSITTLEEELLKPEVYSNHQLAYQKNEELTLVKKQIEKLLEEWENAQQELEG